MLFTPVSTSERLLPQGGGRSQSTLGLHDLDTRACTLSLPGHNDVYAHCYDSTQFCEELACFCVYSQMPFGFTLYQSLFHTRTVWQLIISVHKDKTFISLFSIPEKHTHNYTHNFFICSRRKIFQNDKGDCNLQHWKVSAVSLWLYLANRGLLRKKLKPLRYL